MGEQSAAKTTVVIPVWGAYVTQFLAEALGSIRAQDVPVRIIVVDNASEMAVTAPPGVTLLAAPERLSLGQARNFALTAVTTPLVLFWDADDLMLAGTVAALEAEIAGDPHLVAFGQAILKDDNERFRWPRRWIGRLLRWPKLFVLVHSIWSVYPATGATIMRTDAVRSAGGYADEESGQDWCLGVSLSFRGRLGWSERPGRIYRSHDESVSHLYRGWRDHLRRARTVRTWIRNDPETPGYLRWALPLIQAGQYAAVAGHLLVAGLRRTRTGPR